MSLDELPPLEAHRREREYDRTTHADWLVEQSVDEYDTSGSGWDAVMAASPPHLSSEHWPTGPDRRFYSVDGEVPEQARRDRLRDDMPGWVA